MSLSIFIITKNEEKNLAACLETVKFADEIIIVDSNSTDRTVEIAKQYTDKIYIHDWEGCGPQKKRAFDYTTCQWVLNIDADERLTPELQQEIQQIIKQPEEYAGFEIPFQSYYCGAKIRFGDWMNEKHLRLLKKSKSNIIPRLIHFGIELDGKVGLLKNKIHHYSFPHYEKVIDKINLYSTLGAKEKFKHHKKAGIATILFRSLWTFVRGYILRFGFLDGKAGLFLAVSNTEGCYYKYVKLWYLNQTETASQQQEPS